MGLAKVAGPSATPSPSMPPTPEGSALWVRMQKALAKKQAKVARAGKTAAVGPTSQANSPMGNGPMTNPAWKSLSKVYSG